MELDWDVVGHQKQIEYLQKTIKNGKIGHAYLISGPKNVGKNNLALNFIYTLYCTGPDKKKPCHKCDNCSQLKKQIHPDFIHIQPEEEGKIIAIKQIRGAIEKISKKTLSNNYKICLIEKADLLSLEAANALLKTLEEPKGKTVIILTADKNTLPETIISRCQTISLQPVPAQDIYDFVLNKTNSRDQASTISRLSMHLPGKSEAFLKNKNAIKKINSATSDFVSLLAIKGIEKNRLQEKIIKKQEKNNEILNKIQVWQSILRDLLMVQNFHEEYIFNREYIDQLERTAKTITTKKIITNINKLEIIKNNNKKNINTKLALDNFLLNL
ncbi:MAG: hypothetical protein ABH835_00125 [Patescibacteria group bacterium]